LIGRASEWQSNVHVARRNLLAIEQVDDGRQQLVHSLLVLDGRMLLGVDEEDREHRVLRALALKELLLGIGSFDILIDLLLKRHVIKEPTPRTLLPSSSSIIDRSCRSFKLMRIDQSINRSIDQWYRDTYGFILRQGIGERQVLDLGFVRIDQ